MFNTHNLRSNQSFQGYDARKLKAVAMTQPGYECGIAIELEEISKAAGFNLEILTADKLKPLSYIEENVDPVEKDFQSEATFLDEYEEGLTGFPFQVVNKPMLTSEPQRRGFVFANNVNKWAQDIATVTPHGKVLCPGDLYGLAMGINSKYGNIAIKDKKHIKGGNLFFINADGKDELLVGKDDRRNLCAENGRVDYKKLQDFYGVKKVTFLPQMDVHIDLAIRPLDKKRVLIADDNLTLRTFDEGIQKFQKAIEETDNINKKKVYGRILESLIKEKEAFEKNIKNNEYALLEKTEKTLAKRGFTPIRVPGRIYSISSHLGIAKGKLMVQNSLPSHRLNYMNALVTVNAEGELVYITNKSLVDYDLGITDEIANKVGFSFEKSFITSLASYVKPSNIFFVRGQFDAIAKDLRTQHGGIHCIVSEIPE